MTRRLGCFGGTFDPVHQAHLRMARAFRDELGLDEVRLIPAGQPYHRTAGPQASAQDRLAMVTLALADEPGLVADGREVARLRPAYTVETLAELRSEIGPQAELWCLIGGDSLEQLDTWHRWQDLLRLANIAVALRPGFDAERLPPAVATEWQVRQVTDFSKRTPSGTMRPLALPPVDVSATDIRSRLARGASVADALPPAVAAYIARHGLYRTP